jgi:hypothetical protein
MAWGWIGVDLDGCLALHGDAPTWDGSIGPPVPRMLARVKQWLADGEDVRIVTARLAPYWPDEMDPRHPQHQAQIIAAWCLEHVGQVLPATCQKDYGMRVLWDDRCIHIVHNTGLTLEEYAAEHPPEPGVPLDSVALATTAVGRVEKR